MSHKTICTPGKHQEIAVYTS